MVEGWYLQSLDLFSGCDDFHSTKTRNSRLILTNHTPYNHCFDCRPKWWLCLGPCWLVAAPMYYVSTGQVMRHLPQPLKIPQPTSLQQPKLPKAPKPPQLPTQPQTPTKLPITLQLLT